MRPEVPKEILYVQKLHYLTFLSSINLLLGVIVFIILGHLAVLLLFGFGFILSLLITLRKSQFLSPNNLTLVHSLARNFISHKFEPQAGAIAANQLFYLLGEAKRAETLLKSYMPCESVLIYITLADIYLQQGRLPDALAVLDPVRKQNDPLVLWTFGRILLRQRDYTTALKSFDKAISIIKTSGLPKAGTGFLNNIFMKLSIKAFLFHSLAQCHQHLGNHKMAKKLARKGNWYLIDPTLWYTPEDEREQAIST